MLIILTSIVYSNSRTNEIKKVMLINSDIEELTKKVEVYYLEKETLPLIEDDKSIYLYHEDKNGNDDIDEGEIVYYRLQISLLDNVTLNNKENIKNGTSLEDGEQWYVINKETHTIYFVKSENKQVKLQKAKYSENYADIIKIANTEGIIFNKEDSTGTVSVGNTTISAGIDELIEDTTSINIGTVEGETGNNEGPTEVAGSGTHYDVYDYAGYTYNWTPGSKSNSIVLHYDGIYNALSGSTPSHNTTTSTWSDLSGNGNHGSIVKQETDTWYYEIDAQLSTTAQLTEVDDNGVTTRNTGDKTWLTNGVTLGTKSYVVKESPSNMPTGNSQYTMEIVFNYKGGTKKGLIGTGIYNNTPNTIENMDDYITQWTNSTKLKQIINPYYYLKYNYEPYGDEWYLLSDTLDLLDENYGRANALRINNSGNGITSYYFSKTESDDVDTGNIGLTQEIHTVTVKYDGKNTIIYVDGISKAKAEKSPNTLQREVTIGATNLRLKTILAESQKTSTNYRSGIVRYVFNYEEFFEGTVYSARIYKTALTDEQIYKNHRIDKIRFNF